MWNSLEVSWGARVGIAVQYRLLGVVDVRMGPYAIPITAAKQRVVLAVLLLNANRVVSTRELIRYVWDSKPPASARITVQNYVMRLRRSLDDGGALSTRPDGYLIRADTAQLDVLRFSELIASADVARADGDLRRTTARLREALALWRGQALADVPSESLRREVLPVLAEQRMRAVEARVDADLRLGHHRGLVAELRELTSQHPLRERFWAQLMLALHRSARQAEALDAYRRLRVVLADELGLGPTEELRELHQAILADARLLSRPPERGPVTIGLPPPVPRQLLARPRSFVGRAPELRRLDRLLQEHGGGPSRTRVATISGIGGIGKTWLALHWAHENVENFPDGQLYVNLHGFDPSRAPMDPQVALLGFLDALGVDPGSVPERFDDQAALYRQLIARRRLVILLDNARDRAQVAALLPDGPSCALVTSRRRLADFSTDQETVGLTLDVLDDTDARALLDAAVGGARIAAEPTAVAEFIRCCAGLPLALGVLAARTTARPDFPLSWLAEELADVATRLDALDSGERATNLRSVFASTLSALTADAADLFRLLGRAPRPEISLSAVARLARQPIGPTRDLLAGLEAVHLLVQRRPGRYHMHELVHLYAIEQARG